MENKIKYTLFAFLLFGIINTNVLAADNLKEKKTNDLNTKEDKCPTSLVIQDNLKGSKDMDFSILDCMYYQTDKNGNFILDEMGNKVLRKENDEIDYSCVQKFLDTYSNKEFEEAANNKIDEAFPKIKYCPIYCVEENEFVFPGYAPIVNSGNHFTWTIGKNNEYNMLNGLTVGLHGTKVCRTHVDLKSWVEDYSNIMNDIEQAIDIKNPTSTGNSDCTPSANSGIGTPKTYCGFNTNPIATTYHLMTIDDYNSFKNFNELSQMTGGVAGLSLTNGFIMQPTNPEFGQATSSSQSNRYYITSIPQWIDDSSLNGIIKVYNDGTVVSTDVSKFNNITEMYNAVLAGSNSSSGASKITTVRVRVDTWERHCCSWVIDKESQSNLIYAKSELGFNIDNGMPDSITYGFDVVGHKLGCFLIDNARDVSTFGLVSEHGLNCCGPVQSHRHSSSSSTCILNLPLNQCPADMVDTTWKHWYTYSCLKDNDAINYTRYQKYKVVCGTEGTGDNQNIASVGQQTECTTSSIPKCPSGYSYSPNTRKCYYADYKRIEKDLSQLLGLIHDLK